MFKLLVQPNRHVFFYLTLICIVCLVIVCTFDLIFLFIQQSYCSLKPGNRIFNEWDKPKTPLYNYFYFFNLTNPNEFKRGAMAHLNQIGPYTYLSYVSKEDLMLNISYHEINYKFRQVYYFDKQKSCTGCKEDDKIFHLNIFYISVVKKIYLFNPVFIDVISNLLKTFKSNLIMELTIKQLLWGYEDPILKFISKIIPISSDRIGFFVDQNNTDKLKLAIKDGVLNLTERGSIVKYMDHSMMDVWKSDEANRVGGFDGAFFSGIMKSFQSLEIFYPSLCRSISFDLQSKFSFNKMNVFEYRMNETVFRSGKNYLPNKGFCLDYPLCFKDGVMDLSTCVPDSPMVVSQPHFYRVG